MITSIVSNADYQGFVRIYGKNNITLIPYKLWLDPRKEHRLENGIVFSEEQVAIINEQSAKLKNEDECLLVVLN